MKAPFRLERFDAKEDDGRQTPVPDLVINEGDPTATAKELAALIARREDFLFNGHAPVRVAVEADCLPRALAVTAEAVRVYAHEICSPVKLRSKKGNVERVGAPLTNDIAKVYLNGLEGRWGLKPFRGITTAPILDGKGGIRIASGYDAATGLWCHNIPDLSIPLRPNKQEAKTALLRLRRFFRTFPFADGARKTDDAIGLEVTDLDKPVGLDESSFLTMLLTGVCRQSLELAPGFLCDGPAFSGSGTGKGLLVKSICIIASGVKPSAFTRGHNAEELDKRLVSALTEARPAVFLDNFNSKQIISDTLASILTESPAMVRPMGQTKTVPLHTRTFVGITGNSVEIAEDMARRLLNTYLDARMENPEQRKFEPGFLDRVLAERAAMLSDALVIWRWGRQQTSLRSGQPLGSYEVWAKWCRDPLLELGMRDPVERISEIKAADPRRRELVAVFDAWWGAHKDAVVKATDLAIEVIEHIDLKAIRRSDNSLQFSRQRVAAFLAGHINTRVGGYALTKLPGGGSPAKPVAHYKLDRHHKGE